MSGGGISASGLERRWTSTHRPEGRLVALAGGADRISSATVSKAYDEGDRLARHLVNETSRYLADGLISIVNAFNPSLLILGGGVTEGIPDLASLTEPAVRAPERCRRPSRACESSTAHWARRLAPLGLRPWPGKPRAKPSGEVVACVEPNDPLDSPIAVP